MLSFIISLPTEVLFAEVAVIYLFSHPSWLQKFVEKTLRNDMWKKLETVFECRRQCDLPVSSPCHSGHCRWSCPSTPTQTRARTPPLPQPTGNIDTPSSACCQRHTQTYKMKLRDEKKMKPQHSQSQQTGIFT